MHHKCVEHFPMTKNVREIAASFFSINDTAIFVTLLVIRKCFNTLTIYFMVLIHTVHLFK